jgi:predicted TIM-barrel fold metal-dependent hydrolase
VQALLEAFTPDRCMWGSDWPFLRAPERIDYGLVLVLVERLIPDPGDRRKVLWDTPMRLVRESMVTGQGEAIRRKPDLMVRWF